MYNTVRRMTDTNLTLFPLSQVTVRAGYSQNIFGGPSLTPSGYQFAGSYATVVQEMQRNSTDNFTFGVDWKPVQGTKFTMEEEIDHLKADSYMTVNPGSLVVQEADGTPAALLANSYAQVAYSASNLQCKQHRHDSYPLGAEHSGRPAGDQRGLQRNDQLPALAAYAHLFIRQRSSGSRAQASRMSR